MTVAASPPKVAGPLWLRPVPVAAAGLVATTLLSLAASSTGVFPVVDEPGSWPFSPIVLPRGLGWVCWVLGLAGLSGAWIALHHLARTTALLTVRTVVIVAAVWMLPLLLAPPAGSRDVYSYAAHGELVAKGYDPGVEAPYKLGFRSPYRQGVDRVWRGVVSAYGPASSEAARVAAVAGGHDLPRTIIALRLWMIGGVALMGLGVVVLARRTGTDPVDALVLAVAGPLTLVHLVLGAHNEALMVGLMMAGLALAAVRPGPAGTVGGTVLVALGAAVKLPALVAVVYLGWRYDGRPAPLVVRAGRTLGLLAVAGVTMLAVHLVTGLSWGWLDGLTAGTNVTTFLSLSTTLGLLVRWLFVPFGVARDTTLAAVRNLVQVAGVALAGVLLWRTPRLGLAGLGGALAALAVLGVSVHAWYLVWAMPVLAVAWAGRRATWFVAVAILATVSTRPQGGGLTRNIGFSPLAVGLLVAGALLAWWWLRGRASPGSARRSSAPQKEDLTRASS